MSNLDAPDEPSEGRPMIYAKLAAVMAELPAVGKNSRNEEQGWNFRGIDAVVNAISPALRKHGVIVVPEMRSVAYRDAMTTGRTPRPTREVTVEVAYTFYAEDGSSVTAVVPGESLDQSDKGSAKAMSVAFRIALLQVFALPTSEPDPDASYHTRDGGQSMTPTVAHIAEQTLINAIEPAEFNTAWALIREHSAADRAVPGQEGSSSLTWYELMTRELTARVAAIETFAEGREFKALIEELGFHSMQAGLEQRANFLIKRRRDAFDQTMKTILEAETSTGLETATRDAAALLEGGVLSEAQGQELHKVAHERGQKLRRELNQLAEPSGTDDVKDYAHGGSPREAEEERRAAEDYARMKDAENRAADGGGG
jgi:hypothetical protein